MSITREHHTEFGSVGQVRAVTLSRGSDGAWTVNLAVDVRLVLPDGREVLVQKELSVRATYARGRRPRNGSAGCIEQAAQASGMWPMSGPRK